MSLPVMGLVFQIAESIPPFHIPRQIPGNTRFCPPHVACNSPSESNPSLILKVDPDLSPTLLFRKTTKTDRQTNKQANKQTKQNKTNKQITRPMAPKRDHKPPPLSVESPRLGPVRGLAGHAEAIAELLHLDVQLRLVPRVTPTDRPRTPTL